jgi:hypothetical protein
MKRIFEERIGDARVVIAQTPDGYAGTVLRGGRPALTREHPELEVLKASLRSEAGRLHPDYFGIAGARARFCSFFPGGFSDPAYRSRERGYKDNARAALGAAAPLEQALEPTPEFAVACRRSLATNLLSRFESARLSEVLGSKEGPAFVAAAAAFAIEPAPQSLLAMERAILPHGRGSWPLVTYLPFLWAPESQMFLKPEATKDFAVRVGHHFAQAYEAALEFDVYLSLLDLAPTTQTHKQDQSPADRIDVQSFIWVVGAYTDEDRSEGVDS